MARYELLERIGVGGMAEIYRGKAVAGGGFEKPVAIKRILPHLSQDERFVELLITEAKTLSQLRHRNIVQIYDVGLGDDGQYFLVMEFVDGTDLRAMYEGVERRHTALPLEVSLHIGAEVCEALEHAHRAKRSDGKLLRLVHRDVSPSNILLSRSGEVKLTDFGIAKRMEEATGHGGVRGKFAYISPEQAANVHVDARSDVYSCAIVLYELIVGKRLFSGMPDFEALRAVREGRVVRPREQNKSVAPDLEALLMQALSANPDQRFETAGQFGAKLRAYRYTMESSIADPARELANLIERADREHGPPETDPRPSVVKISTAAGFTAADFVANEPRRSGRVPPPVPPQTPIEYAETQIAPFGQDSFDDAETRAVTIENVPRHASDGDDDEDTRLLHRPPGLDEFRPTEPHAPVTDGMQTLGAGEGGPIRPETPRLRELFRPPQPGPGHSPYGAPIPRPSVYEDEQLLGLPKRKAILILGIVAVVLAVVAFVITGALLGSAGDGAGAGAGAAADAGPAAVAAPDAAEPDAGQPDAAPVKKKRKKRRKKRRKRRR